MAAAAVVGTSALYRAALVSLLNKIGFEDAHEGVTVSDLKAGEAQKTLPELLLVYLGGSPTRARSGTNGNDLPERDYIADLVNEAKAWNPLINVVFVARDLEVDLLISCFSAGASGYLLENISRRAFEKSLKLVRTGESVFPSQLAAMLPDLIAKCSVPDENALALSDYSLSDREIDILRCLTNGQSNKLIARNLNIAESTVKVHVKRIMQKINATNRTQAALWGVARGMSNPISCDTPKP